MSTINYLPLRLYLPFVRQFRTWEESLDIFLPDEDSSSDVYDEADEDSNAEDYYTNEYPDEWEGSEAEYGSEDEYDGMPTLCTR